MVDAPKSPLPLVVFDNKDSWNTLLQVGVCDRLTLEGLLRLQALLKHNVKSIVVEKHYLDKDYRDTFSSFHSKKFTTLDSRCERLHFFSIPLSREDIENQDKLQGGYLGYSIIRPTRPNSIGRTLIDPHRLGLVKGWLRLCEERVSLIGITLQIKGFPFISQDGDATVCAQSALWMMLRYYSNKYHHYREIYPSEIALLVKDFSIGRIQPSTGLTDWQMAECLRQLSFAPVIYSRDNDPKKLFDFNLYTYIESGIPLLISYLEHVVVGYGHTSNFKRRLPKGRAPVLTSHFKSGFIVSDDNLIPYQLIDSRRRQILKEPSQRLSDIQSFIVPLPSRVHLTAEDALGCCLKLLLLKDQFGYQTASKFLKRRRPVLRLFLTTCRSFKRHLRSRKMGHPLAVNLYKHLPMPHFIWVCEISIPESFSDGKVWGEIIWDATRNAREPNGWIAVHYPEKIFLDSGSAFNGQSDIREFSLPGGTKYPLFSHNLEPIK